MPKRKLEGNRAIVLNYQWSHPGLCKKLDTGAKRLKITPTALAKKIVAAWVLLSKSDFAKAEKFLNSAKLELSPYIPGKQGRPKTL